MVKRVLLMAIIAMQVVAGWAETEVVNGIEWTYTITDGKASVGGGSSSKTAVLGTTSGEITIPSTLGGCPVTGIADSAFYNCREITSITIPNGVEYIGNDVGVYRADKASFGNCWSLTSITIPSSVTNITPSSFFRSHKLHDIIVDSNNKSYKMIDGLLLSIDGTQLIASSMDKINVEIPNGVTNIEFGAFADCASLTSVVMPDSVANIGPHAFFCCAALVNLSLSKNISFIGDKSFESCRSLKNIVIPSGVESIEYKAFFDCASLESVTIPDSVVAIWDGAFGYCTSLTSVIIPDSVTSIYNRAFENCTNLTKISMPLALKEQVEEENIFEDCSENLEIVYRESVEWEYTVTDGKSTITGVPTTISGDVIIPSTLGGNPVTSIGEWAFSGCYSLTSVTIPDSVTSIGDFAFCDCALKSVTIPDSVTSIGLAAFSYCESLTSVTIPNTVANIGDGAFSDCYSLQTIIVEEDNNNYKSIDGLLLSKDGKALIACPGIKTNVKIPDGVTSIRDVAIAGCRFLTSVTIPDSVTNIGNSVFAECISLTSVTIPDSVTSIGIYAFSYCESLTSVAIPDSVTSIGEYAFQDCADLVKVSLPLALKEQVEEGNVFDGCSDDLEIVYREPVEWEYTVTDGKATITGVPETVSGEVIISSTLGGYPVTSIGDNAFSLCNSLTSVTIPNNVTSIGDGAFYKCSSLASVAIPDSVTSIGEGAFYYCSSLTNVTIPNSVTSIGDSAFRGCNSFTSVIIPDSVTSIGNSVFVNCLSLTSVTIPDSVTSIGEYAFRDCARLVKISLPLALKVQVEEGNVFEGCSENLEIVYRIEVFPVISEDSEVAAALEGSADAKLAENITTAAEYAAFREWAMSLENVALEEVKSSPNAWLSYALNTEKLIVTAPKEGDIVIDTFETSSTDGVFEFIVKLKDIQVDEGALEENIRKVLGVEGATDLENATFSTDLVEIKVVSVEKGNLKFSVEPNVVGGGSRTSLPTRFFFRIKLFPKNTNAIRDMVQLWEGGPYWATTNIGAEKPEDYGYYFWWGDTVGYKRENDKWVASDGSNSDFSFDWDTCPTWDKDISTLRSEGWIISKDDTYVLAPEHDAAQAHWGGDWRMPTYSELNDLCHYKCDWTWSSVNGVNGYIVRGRGSYASNSIFLPCAGYGIDTSFYNSGSSGHYRSSQPMSVNEAFILFFDSSYHYTDDRAPLYGFSIRPVQGFSK